MYKIITQTVKYVDTYRTKPKLLLSNLQRWFAENNIKLTSTKPETSCQDDTTHSTVELNKSL